MFLIVVFATSIHKSISAIGLRWESRQKEKDNIFTDFLAIRHVIDAREIFTHYVFFTDTAAITLKFWIIKNLLNLLPTNPERTNKTKLFIAVVRIVYNLPFPPAN
jgi:hypothetical protein